MYSTKTYSLGACQGVSRDFRKPCMQPLWISLKYLSTCAETKRIRTIITYPTKDTII